MKKIMRKINRFIENTLRLMQRICRRDMCNNCGGTIFRVKWSKDPWLCNECIDEYGF